MRLFVGIALTPDAATALEQIRNQLAPKAGDSVRWPGPENWHVTLQFLGNTTEERAACVTNQLATIHANPVPVRLAELGFFPRVGVFHAGVDLSPELLSLQQRVTAATRPCGFIPEDRPYHPHITLARSKGRGGAQALAPLQKAVEQHRIRLAARFLAEEFLLYESFPGPEGSRYEARARFPLLP